MLMRARMVKSSLSLAGHWGVYIIPNQAHPCLVSRKKKEGTIAAYLPCTAPLTKAE